ncbi:MAG TPA: F0F1 ATP synthase subunit epsilon [Dehalococcoidia bacterium]|nr:F0F1 ATP synthase subunit epsilon [Dehalococcoidia bacterium]
MPLTLEVVTAERLVLDESGIDVVIAPGIDGELAILPEHAPLITPLAPGELRVRRGVEENSYFVAGGFLEVLRDKVTILADAAEHAEEIDIARAEEARRRAQESLTRRHEQPDVLAAEGALRRSLIRLRVAERSRRSRPGPGMPHGHPEA